MAEPHPSAFSDGASPKPERVGIILVHGIGEQGRFEHLEAHARDLVDAMLAREERASRKTSVSVELMEAEGAAYKAAQASWASAGPTLHAVVKDGEGSKAREVHLCFHEVWYADISEKFSLWKQVRFWAWGLAMWAVREKLTSEDWYYRENMREPHVQHPMWLRLKVRSQLYMVACLSLLATFSITPVAWILNRLNFGSFDFIKVFVNYVSVVKLYNQKTRSGGSPLDALRVPPRTFIRQRMIRTICDVVASDYDRWYILAHSLGSVVAFNALMEPDEVLPNYLDSKRWQEIAPKAHDARIDIALQKRRPSRPAWIPPTVALSRRTLFQGFKGLLTYGSPLDKFATLWPARVPLNKEENVFRDDVEWVNVYDVTDPVGAHLDYFEPAAPGPGRIRALNLCYKASPIMLWSHVGYLRTHRNRRDELADRTVEWLVSGGPFPQPSAPSSAWLDTGKKATFARWALAYWVQLPLIAAFLFGLGLLVVHYGLTHLPWGLGSEIASLGWAGQAAMLALVALGIPLLFGAVRWLVFPPDKDDPAYKSAKVSQQLAGVVETVSSAMGARIEPGAGPMK